MQYPYQNPQLSVQARVDDLLSRMTLEEKFQQLRLVSLKEADISALPFRTDFLEPLANRLGSVYCPHHIPPENLRKMQDWIMAHSRWGIPAAVHGESLHGAMAENCTCFPQAVGLGATFDPALLTEIVTQIGKEARANGVTMTYAPNVDLSRDPRWGRVEENYGEDPYLTSVMGVAYVKALQAQGVSACPKHYIAHGSPEGGINLAPVHAGEREFYETMAVPFEKVVREGKTEGIMPAYSEWDGEPIHASRRLLTGLLREKWGFTGQVVSDYAAVSMLHTFQKVAPDATTAGRMALSAGVDVEAPNLFGFGEGLMEAVRKGAVAEALVDTAVARVLKHKFEKGLFENPYADEAAQKENRSAAALALARRAASDSCVLLKNEGILPLSDSVGKVAVIGPNADSPQPGDYTVPAAIGRTVTLRNALEDRLGKERVLFSKGCSTAYGTDEQLAHAVDTAKQADVAIVVVGDNSNSFGGVGWAEDGDGSDAYTCGEGFDVHDLDLPGRQQQLLQAVYATGTPTVLVMVSGRPHSILWADAHVPAILQAWYPGEQGGHGVADVLFGDADPGGRLPISFPRSVGHIPCFYNHKVSARGFYKKRGSAQKSGRDYVFDTPDALYPFGYGLSYTTFAYHDLSVPEKGKTDGEITVSVTVENTGSRRGAEVVQLYVTDRFCRITPFVKQLRGFQKLWLEPGEKKTVAFTLGFEDFAFINENMEREVEPGEFIIRVGGLEASVILE